MIDFHIHSNFSTDGKASMEEICEAAVELGISALCFTDHYDFDPQDTGYGFFDYDEYSRQIERVRRKFSGRLMVYKGVEVDYQSRFEENIRRGLAGKNFELVMGSVHYVDGEIIADDLIRNKDLEEIYSIYLNEVRISAESGLFNCVGHFDYVKKYTGKNDILERKEQLVEQLKDTLRAIIDRGILLEINTKGLIRKPRNFYPDLDILKLFKKLGGENVIVGSDAHCVEEIGLGVNAAVGICQELGFSIIDVPNDKKLKLA